MALGICNIFAKNYFWADDDLLYDEISSGLLIAEIKRNRQELLESLTLYYRVFILGEDVSALLEEED